MIWPRLLPVAGKALLACALIGLGDVAAVSLSGPTNYPVGNGPVGVAIGDFSCDGNLDLAVANSGSNNVSILLGNGDGAFTAGMNYSVGQAPSFVAVGFFDSDLHQGLRQVHQLWQRHQRVAFIEQV